MRGGKVGGKGIKWDQRKENDFISKNCNEERVTKQDTLRTCRTAQGHHHPPPKAVR